jgi:hypothetical protein
VHIGAMTCVVAVLVTGLVSFALGCSLGAALMRSAKPRPAERAAEPAELTVPAERIVGIDVDRLSEAERRMLFEN